MMDASRQDALAYTTFPKETGRRSPRPNLWKAVNKEVKRKADVIGIFPNDAAVVRPVGALMLDQNGINLKRWPLRRCFLASSCPEATDQSSYSVEVPRATDTGRRNDQE